MVGVAMQGEGGGRVAGEDLEVQDRFTALDEQRPAAMLRAAEPNGGGLPARGAARRDDDVLHFDETTGVVGEREDTLLLPGARPEFLFSRRLRWPSRVPAPEGFPLQTPHSGAVEWNRP